MVRKARSSGPTEYAAWIEIALDFVLLRCHTHVDKLVNSPIVKVFLRSLFLAFAKNHDFLVFMKPFSNTPEEINEFDRQIEGVRDFHRWYKEKFGSITVSGEYLDGEVRAGRVEPEERPWIEELLLLYCYLPLDRFWHVSLQSEFPNLLPGSESPSSVDMLFWRPFSTSFKVAVECDGFGAHRKRRAFIRDRRKDRALQKLGFQVLRFAGHEINRDPISAASEVFYHLSALEPVDGGT